MHYRLPLQGNPAPVDVFETSVTLVPGSLTLCTPRESRIWGSLSPARTVSSTMEYGLSLVT